MSKDVTGLHHVTAIAGSAQGNVAFYSGALGLRLVKKTVNFDDPSAWHLYYADETGTPGTVMTFFAWARGWSGRVGRGQASVTQFAVPDGALPFWTERLPVRGATLIEGGSAFGARRVIFEDPDGLVFALVETADDPRAPWTTDEIGADVAIRGFHGVTLALGEAESTARILSEAFGYETEATEGATTRMRLPGSPSGVVDLLVDPALAPGADGAGAVHHVAFAVPDRAAQLRARARLEAAGLRVTPPIDRDYFWAIYARTPGGVLFEVATNEPGFATDEPVESLGTELRLPERHAPHRAEIERILPPLAA